MAVRNAISRGELLRVDDSGRMQYVRVKGFAGEIIEGAEHWLPYGFTAHPLPGAEPLIIPISGARDHASVLLSDRRYRLRGLPRGEVAIHDDQGQVIHLTRDGIIIKTAKTVRVEGKRVEITATDAVHIGAGGVGPTYTPTHITYYTQGIFSSTVPPLEVASR